jgi:hypothetical protein
MSKKSTNKRFVHNLLNVIFLPNSKQNQKNSWKLGHNVIKCIKFKRLSHSKPSSRLKWTFFLTMCSLNLIIIDGEATTLGISITMSWRAAKSLKIESSFWIVKWKKFKNSLLRILEAYQNSQYPRSFKNKRVDLCGLPRQCA